MFHYLYYKLYQASLKSSLNDMPMFMTAVSFGGLIALNIFVIVGFLAKLDLLPFYTNKHQAGLSVVACIILTTFYFNKKRIELILKNAKEKISSFKLPLIPEIYYIQLKEKCNRSKEKYKVYFSFDTFSLY